MFQITKNDGCLLVELKSDFDYSTIKQIIYDKNMIAEIGRTNDIWLIGDHRALLRLGDIQLLVDDFTRLYPQTAGGKKIAMVVTQGLTEAIIRLLAKGMERHLPISCRVFQTLDDARQWLRVEDSRVA